MKLRFLIALVILLSTRILSAQVMVIANKSVPQDTIKKTELVDFYTGDIKVWSDNSPVVVFDLKPREDVREAFYKYLGKSSSRMKSIWLKKMLSGEGDPPEAMKSEADMLRKVAATPGAIGFVSVEKLNRDVKPILLIDEKKK